MEKKLRGIISATSHDAHDDSQVKLIEKPKNEEDEGESIKEISSSIQSSIYEESSTYFEESLIEEQEAAGVTAEVFSDTDIEDDGFVAFESEMDVTTDTLIESQDSIEISRDLKIVKKSRSIEELLQKLNEKRKHEFDKFKKPPKEEEKRRSITMSPSFFEALFPLITEEKPCATESKFKCGYFEPKKTVDCVWMHSVLGEAGYKNYSEPIKFSGKPLPERKRTEPLEALCAIPKPKPSTFAQRIDLPRLEEQRRIQLAWNFSNRTKPWYIPDGPQIDTDFQITETVRNIFTNPLDLRILQNIQMFECRLLIIDVAMRVEVEDLKRWLKFCNYVHTIMMLRCPLIARQVDTLGDTFHALHFEDNRESPWHRELEASLCCAVKYAKEKHLYTNCMHPFVFVFSSKRGMSSFNSVKVLRKA